MSIKKFLFLGFFVLITACIQAQDFNPGEDVVVTLVDGSVIRGKFQSKTDTELTLSKGEERIIILLEKVLYYSDVDVKNEVSSPGDYRDYADQYSVFPSALPVEHKKIYYRNIDLFANIFSFGISERFSLNAGFESLSILAGNTPVLFATPKLNLPVSDQFHMSVGTTVFVYESESAALLFGNATVGNTMNNFTVGLAFGYADGETTDKPILFLGYQFALSRKVSLLGEFVGIDIGDDMEGLFDISLRFKTRGGYAFDFGIARPIDNDVDGVLPIITFTIPLNK